MNSKDQIVKQKIEDLKSEIEYHNNLYYNEDINEITDLEFDKKLSSLIELEKKYPEFKTNDSPSQRVGGTITKKFETKNHETPMLSLSNTYSESELIDFDKRMKKNLPNQKIDYTCEIKYDGVALSLIYENRKLKYALTRGDGKKGDNITTNAYTIRSIPLKLSSMAPSYLEVRGEVFISKSNFKKLNYYKKKNNDPLFANARNTASGSLKLQDSSEVAKRKLDCFVYSLNSKFESVNNHNEALKTLKNLNFNVPDSYKKCNNIEEVISYIKFWENKRENLDVETDGIVIKVNNFNQQKELGFTSKNPRWAIAYKYKSESAETILKDITYQVGRTGAITPVAHLKPIKLSGSIIRKASLYNFNEIKRLDLRIGDTITIEKGGEIIPKITGVKIDRRSNESKAIKFITKCPSCNSQISKIKNEANYYCRNHKNCLPQIVGKVQHFIGKEAMNIEFLGPETIKGLINNDLIKNIADLYKLNYDDLFDLKIEFKNSEGERKIRSLKEKSCQNILNSIIKSKNSSYSNILFGLGIRYVGKSTAEVLSENFKSIQKLINAKYDDIIQISEIGYKIAESISHFFSDNDNISIISELEKNGLKLYSKKNININSSIRDIKFVITGTFDDYSRNELKNIIKRYGGKVSSSISKNTDFLILGENFGPSKKSKADNLGTNIISENDFKNLLLK